MAGIKSKKAPSKRRKATKAKRIVKKSAARKSSSKSLQQGFRHQLKLTIDTESKALSATIKQETSNIKTFKAAIKKATAEVATIKAKMAKAKTAKRSAANKKALAKQKSSLASLLKSTQALNADLKKATDALTLARSNNNKLKAANKLFAQFEKDWAKKEKTAATKTTKKPVKTVKKSASDITKSTQPNIQYVEQPVSQAAKGHTDTATNGIDREHFESVLSDNIRHDESSEVTSN